MVTFSGLTRTMQTTMNPYSCLLLKFSDGRKTVRFKNGSTMKLTWSQFRTFRDSYSLVQKYRVEQVADEVFRVHGDGFELVGSMTMLFTVDELSGGEYNWDCKEKVVLDVGGFEGESAVLFSRMGAKKIIIYEPVPAHIGVIKENISLNHVNAEIHNEGVGVSDGVVHVQYRNTDNCFGLHPEGANEMEISVKAVADVILKSGADLAKFDCEGAEESLAHVPAEILRKIGSYIIEVHSQAIKKAIIRKFEDSGFSLVRSNERAGDVAVLSFRRDAVRK